MGEQVTKNEQNNLKQIRSKSANKTYFYPWMLETQRNFTPWLFFPSFQTSGVSWKGKSLGSFSRSGVVELGVNPEVSLVHQARDRQAMNSSPSLGTRPAGWPWASQSLSSKDESLLKTNLAKKTAGTYLVTRSQDWLKGRHASKKKTRGKAGLNRMTITKINRDAPRSYNRCDTLAARRSWIPTKRSFPPSPQSGSCSRIFRFLESFATPLPPSLPPNQCGFRLGLRFIATLKCTGTGQKVGAE